jgi:hypothetical protein
MAPLHTRLTLKALTIIGLLFFNLSLKAQLYSTLSYKKLKADSSIKANAVYLFEGQTGTTKNIIKTGEQADASGEKISKFQEHKRLMTYLKKINVNEDISSYQSKRKLYYHMANIFAHLRLYPLAMKCYFKSLPVSTDSVRSLNTDTTENSAGYLTLNSTDDSVVNKASILVQSDKHQIRSKVIQGQHIISLFNDGKPAVAYAMLFHVKQPSPGKRKVFAFTNTGHTFITLIKYNADSTYVSASFGFYPNKDQLFSATPLAPTTSATFKDDAGHQWDEVLGKFISKRRFEKILLLTKDYENIDYNLSSNNCTDFGIKAAIIAGVNIKQTAGKWPLGKGNNPGVTGQSILEGKVTSTDAVNKDDIYIDIDPAIRK